MADPKKEHTVVVVAYGPWGNVTRNPVQDVKLALPDRIERPGRTPIRIVKFHRDLANHLSEMTLVAELWSGDPRLFFPETRRSPETAERLRIDAMLFLGMGARDVWRVESIARRDGYDWVGDDGLELPRCNGGVGGRWEGLPLWLTPFFDIDAIVDRLHNDLPDLACEKSTDAGPMYCGFVFYTMLAELYRRGEPARGLFLHHPGNKADEEGAKEGAKVATSVITSMVDQLNSG